MFLPAKLDLDWYGCGFRNPCGKSKDLFYYPSVSPRVFVQCGQSYYQCYYQHCAPGTIWNQTLLSCVHNPRSVFPRITHMLPIWPKSPFVNGTYNCEDKNPCTVENAEKNLFYFPHETSGKYVQCNNLKKCFTKDCPEGQVWDAAGYTCDKPRPSGLA